MDMQSNKIRTEIDAPYTMKLDNLGKKEIETKVCFNKKDYTNNWVSSSDFDTISEISSSVVDSEDLDSTIDFNALSLGSTSISTQDESTQSSKNIQSITDNSVQNLLQTVFTASNNMQTVENVVIENSKQIHIGNVINISGPIHITHTGGGSVGTINQASSNKHTTSNKKKITSKQSNDVLEDSETDEVNRDTAAFLGNIRRQRAEDVLTIIERRAWLAQSPLVPWDTLDEPVPLVIISHTATEIAYTQADNIYLCRHIQCFHIESCRWNDISYNFMIGGDGNIYEGRGWAVIGAHTKGYNKKSIGISFIGCFMTNLPPDISLSACKLLIQKGVEDGHIAKDYKLLAHCQCSSTESPGRKLYEYLQTWQHFGF